MVEKKSTSTHLGLLRNILEKNCFVIVMKVFFFYISSRLKLFYFLDLKLSIKHILGFNFSLFEKILKFTNYLLHRITHISRLYILIWMLLLPMRQHIRLVTAKKENKIKTIYLQKEICGKFV